MDRERWIAKVARRCSSAVAVAVGSVQFAAANPDQQTNDVLLRSLFIARDLRANISGGIITSCVQLHSSGKPLRHSRKPRCRRHWRPEYAAKRRLAVQVTTSCQSRVPWQSKALTMIAYYICFPLFQYRYVIGAANESARTKARFPSRANLSAVESPWRLRVLYF